jgi:hypothetical protein
MTKASAWEMVVTRELETNEHRLRKKFMLMFIMFLSSTPLSHTLS